MFSNKVRFIYFQTEIPTFLFYLNSQRVDSVNNIEKRNLHTDSGEFSSEKKLLKYSWMQKLPYNMASIKFYLLNIWKLSLAWHLGDEENNNIQTRVQK